MKDDAVFLVHRLERARRIQRHVHSREQLRSSEPIQDLVIRSFEVIGEAATRVSPRFRQSRPELPWKAIIGFRNVLIHGYAEVDLDLVWAHVDKELVPLINALEGMLRELGVDPGEIR